jgi:EmrB/QacA subfamily drug resistance transporter
MFDFLAYSRYTNLNSTVQVGRGAVSKTALAPPGLRAATAPDPHRWRALVLLCLAQFMVILDVTVVNVALPAIGADLALDRAALTWVVTAYTLCFGGLMLLGGRLADLLGRRRTFLAGLTVFTLASLSAGLAGDGAVLLAARATQGIGAALLSPAALSIITTTFHGPERRRALAVWAGIGGTGAAVGVLLGGLLASGPGWEWVFFVNVPVGLLVAVGAALTVAGSPRPAAARAGAPRAEAVDVPGALAVTAAIGLLVYGLVRAGDTGWGAAGTLPLGAGLALLAVFVAVERRVTAPLVDLRLVATRPVAAGYGVMLAASGLLISGFFLNSLLLQRVMGLSALGTGLVFLPVAVATIIGAQAAAHLLGRVGGRPVAAIGFALAAAGMALLAGVAADGDALTGVLPGFVLAAAGLGMAFVTATTTAMSRVDPHRAGMVSGVVNTAHELGAALGVAIVSTIAGTSVGTGSAGAPVAGFGDAFLACAIVAAVAAVTMAWALPPGRPATTDGPLFAH